MHLGTRLSPHPRPQIVRCCQHYESKCAGKYDKGSIGARLLFDLSRDIQDLSQSLVQRDDDRDDRVRHLEVSLSCCSFILRVPCSPEVRVAPPVMSAKRWPRTSDTTLPSGCSPTPLENAARYQGVDQRVREPVRGAARRWGHA